MVAVVDDGPWAMVDNSGELSKKFTDFYYGLSSMDY